MVNKIFAAMILMLVLIGTAAAMPPIAAEFYGTATINTYFAEKGMNVSIYDDNGVLCGSGLVRDEGQFGFISCNGDDPYTEEDEGATKGENVSFNVNGTYAGNTTWNEGSVTEIRIDIRPVRVTASLPEAILMLPLIPLMALVAGYLYARKKI
jgi:hypothetical protein